MIDEVFKHLRSKMATEEWTSLDELSEIVGRHGLTQNELEEIVGFLRKYFLEVDERKQKVRLNSWTYDLFESSIS